MAKSFLQRRYLIPQKLIPLGSWKGVRDIGDSGGQSPEYLQDCINGLFVDPVNGGRVEARPGFARISASSLGSNIRTLHAHETDAGTFYMFAFTSGDVLYRQSSATGWTDVSPATIGNYTTSSGVSRLKMLSFNGEVIAMNMAEDAVAPSGGQPIRLTSLGSTPVVLTEIEIDSAAGAWSARGTPQVYGAKLFFIAGQIGSTNYSNRIVWSEELDAATGYMQTGYTNFWDLAPSTTAKIHALLATNSALYYFRRHSIGAIYGAVNADFQTSSTHDDVSQEIGVLPLSQPLLAKNYVWFLNADGLPHRFAVGSRNIEPIWQQMAQRINRMRIARTGTDDLHLLEYTQAVYLHDLNKVAFHFLADSDGGQKSLYLFDADTGSYEGRWHIELASQPASDAPSAISIDSIASLPRSTAGASHIGVNCLHVGGVSSTDELVWRQTLLKEYTFGDNSAAMHFSITPMLAPNEQVTEFRVDEIAIDAVPDSGTMSIDYYTPRASSVGQLTMTGITGSDSIQSSYDHGRYVAGLNALGRWFRPVLHWNVPSGVAPYAFERAILKVRGFPASPRAK